MSSIRIQLNMIQCIMKCPKYFERYQNNNEITSKRKDLTLIVDGDTSKVIIQQATTRLAGTYICVAENEVGITETRAKLSVHSNY